MKRILTFLFLFSSLFASSQTQFLGAPNTTIVVKGNMKVDSILYLPKRSKTPTDTGALRYQISDSSLYVWTGSAWRKAKNDGTVTSVGLTMPTAFAVANSPVTSSGTLAVTATGSATEYIRGDGTLGTLPTSGGGGGSGVNYYLNGSVSQGTIGGSTYYEMSKTPIVGAGTNFTAAADGLMQQFITDAGDPNRLLIPAGAWNFELYFSASSAGGTPTFYVELLKYDGTTFTSISSSSASPQAISNGTTKTLYFTSLAVSETVLLATDRLAIRVYVNVSGRTITFYTEDANLAEVITTFSGGLVSLNGLTANDQFFATGTTGTNFNIASTSATHTFNLPTASATNRGALSSTDWSTFNNKVNISDTAAMLTNYIRHGGYGLTKTGQALSVDTLNISTKAWRQKGIDSVASVRVGGTGTTNYVSKWTGTSTQAISQIFDNGTNVGIGTTTTRGISGVAPGVVQVTGSAGSTGGLTIAGQLANNTNGDFLQFVKSRGTTNVAVQSGDNLGGVLWGAADGTNYIRAAQISAFIDATPGTNDMPTSLRFSTTRDATSTPTAVMDINNAGEVIMMDNPTDAGAYRLQVGGAIYNTTGAAFATSSGNVLVGTTTDGGSYKLDVQGALRNTTGANFATSSGNVVVGGTGTGSYKLDITGDLRSSGSGTTQTVTNTTNANGAANLYQQSGSNIGWIGNGSSSVISGSTSDFGMNSQADLFLASGGFRIVTIKNVSSDGRVGIGTTSPSEKLHVTGRIRATTIDSTATGMNMLYSDANGVIKKAAVPTGGSGTVTSVATGFGLSGGTITTTGTLIVDSASVATRARVQKGIDSVATLANTKLSGTGITGYFPKWTGTATQDTSQLFQLGRNIGIGTATPAYRLHLPDAGNTANQAMIAGSVFGSDGNGQTITPGSGAMTYYGQGGVGYLYGAQVSSAGRWGINTRSLNDATFNVDGSVKIVTIDSTSTARNMLYQDANGVIKKSAVPTGSGTITTSEAVISANYTVTSTDYFVFLPALETAGRNIVLPSDPGNGRQLIFFNTSNDATYKWTFTNVNVQDATGTVVTTLANSKSYTLVYYSGLFRITSVY